MNNLSGKNDGFEWTVNVRPSLSGGYYALVRVGGTLMTTPNFDDPEECEAAGCSLMADTLAELLDVQNAI